MLRLQQPTYTHNNIIDLLTRNMKDEDLVSKLNDLNNCNQINNIWKQYDILAQNQQLFSIPQYTQNGILNNVVGNLNYDDCIKLYTRYFSVQGKEIRRVYDAILVQSEKCPYCGNIGTSAQLDHYLPKQSYPQYSVYPKNLIPCCRDCNEGYKKAALANTEAEQLINPYFDKNIFFSEQWIFATYQATSLNDRSARVIYSVNCPSNWADIDKARAQKHFNDLGLGARFAKEANNQLQTLIPHLQKFLDMQWSYNEIYDFYINSGSHRSINHWERVMYQALCNYIQTLIKDFLCPNSQK